MARTLQQQLDAVDAAIEALETGGHSSYSISGRSVTKLELGALYVERQRLQRLVDREAAGGMFRGAKIVRPRT
jgi:hypothetical protein